MSEEEVAEEEAESEQESDDPLQDEGSDAARFSSLQLDMLDDMRCVFIYSESIALTMLHGYLDERGDVRSAA